MSGEPLQALAAVTDGWLVGGAVRDRLLGRPLADFDVVIRGDVAAAAHRLARALEAHRFELSEGFGAWRVVARDHAWQIDLMPVLGDSIEDDLARRDLTINAIAEPLAGGDPIDPFGGRADLAAGRVRMVGPRSFPEDPLRVMRVVRHACELGFEIEPQTLVAAREAAPGVAGVAAERVFAELRRIVAADAAVAGFELLERVGATAIVLPELAALHDVEQSHFHHRDVHDHTMLVLTETIALERDPEPLFPGDGDGVGALLREPLAGGLTRSDGLRFGALLHDIAKPQTRSVTDSGRVTFMGHDVAGAELSRVILGRLRAGERLADHVAALARHHLRLGFLVHDAPLDRHAVYRYLRDCEPVPVDVSLLSVADRLATQGRNAEAAIAKHLNVARSMVADALAWRAAPPEPLVRGDVLGRALGLRPGPEIGRLLRAIDEASFAGEVSSAEDAIALARELLAGER